MACAGTARRVRAGEQNATNQRELFHGQTSVND